jgi:hypothetical protein
MVLLDEEISGKYRAETTLDCNYLMNNIITDLFLMTVKDND